MTSQDTKLPWKFSGGDIVDDGGVPWVLDTDEDIAAFIVRAVNHHEALVEMVRELRTLVRVTGPMTTARERADKLLAALDAENA